MKPNIKVRFEDVKQAIMDAGVGLPIHDWKELLEEISAEVEAHLEAVK